MAQVKNKVKGEYTYPSDYSEIPDGGLVGSLNINVDRSSIAQPRRGLNKYKAFSAVAGDRGDSLMSFKGDLIASYKDSLLDGKLSRDGSDPFTAISGTYDAPDHGGPYIPKIKGVEANKNFYFISKEGVKKMTSASTTPINAGIQRGLDLNLSLNAAVGGFMSDNTNIAYRIVWGIRDANDNLILGAPSGRAVIGNNSGVSKNVDLDFSIPDQITTSHFYQVYRSGESPDINIQPNDELQLVIEDNPTAGEILAKSIQITDVTPNDLRGETIYTAPSQEGIAQSNDTPPSAKDICVFRNMGFLSNTIQKQNFELTLLAVGGASGIAIGDTIIIDGVTYTAAVAENVATGDFQLFTGGIS